MFLYSLFKNERERGLIKPKKGVKILMKSYGLNKVSTYSIYYSPTPHSLFQDNFLWRLLANSWLQHFPAFFSLLR